MLIKTVLNQSKEYVLGWFENFWEKYTGTSKTIVITSMPSCMCPKLQIPSIVKTVDCREWTWSEKSKTAALVSNVIKTVFCDSSEIVFIDKIDNKKQ